MMKEERTDKTANQPSHLLELYVDKILTLKTKPGLLRRNADGGFVAVQTYGCDDKKIMQLDANGKLLTEYQCPAFKECWSNFIITEDNHIIARRKDTIICQWDLKKKQLAETEVVHEQFRYCQANFFYFRSSNLLCHCLESNRTKFLLSYFKLPLVNSQAPFHQFIYDLPSSIFNLGWAGFYLRAAKMNEKSMVRFIPHGSNKFELKNNKVSFAVYDLDEESNKGALEIIRLDVDLNPNKHEFLFAEIKDSWEVMPQVLYIQVETQVSIKKSKPDPSFDEQKQERYHTLYYNMVDKTTRIGKTDIGLQHRLQFINTMRELNCCEAQKWSIKQRLEETRESREYGSRRLISVPIYYIDPWSQTLLACSPQTESNIYERFQWLQSSDCNYIKKIFEPGSKTEIQLMKYPDSWRIYKEEPRIVSAFLVTRAVEDCDDDLLDLICQLLQ